MMEMNKKELEALENQKQKAALNEEALDEVAGGIMHYCSKCGKFVSGRHECC